MKRINTTQVVIETQDSSFRNEYTISDPSLILVPFVEFNDGTQSTITVDTLEGGIIQWNSPTTNSEIDSGKDEC